MSEKGREGNSWRGRNQEKQFREVSRTARWKGKGMGGGSEIVPGTAGVGPFISHPVYASWLSESKDLFLQRLAFCSWEHCVAMFTDDSLSPDALGHFRVACVPAWSATFQKGEKKDTIKILLARICRSPCDQNNKIHMSTTCGINYLRAYIINSAIVESTSHQISACQTRPQSSP